MANWRPGGPFRWVCPVVLLNSLTPQSVLVGMKNSRSESFLLAKHTAHKHTPSSSIALIDYQTKPPGASAKGVGGEVAFEAFSVN
jgi:hypothetical protein